MAITYYEWLDYSQVKYTDNCICDIPMYDKNGLNDQRGIHNFKVSIYAPAGDTADTLFDAGFTNFEDLEDIKGYYYYLEDLKDSGSTTNIRNSATTVYGKMRGEIVIDSNSTDKYMDYRPIWETPDRDGKYGGVAIPSLNAYARGIGVTNSKLFPGCYYNTKWMYNYNKDCVDLNPNPFNIRNPKTNLYYNAITCKLDYYYVNAHRFFINHAEWNDYGVPVYGTTVGKEYSYYTFSQYKLYLQGRFTYLNSSGTEKITSKILDFTARKGNIGFGWHNITYTFIRSKLAGSSANMGGKIIAYINSKDDIIEFNLEEGTHNYLGQTTTNSYTMPGQCYNPTALTHTLIDIDSSGNTGRASYNKNFIRNLQIFNGEDYNEIATEPMKFINMNEDKKLYRVVTNNNELKKKSYRCYEYR